MKLFEVFRTAVLLGVSGVAALVHRALPEVTLASVKQFAMLCVPLKAMTMVDLLQESTACSLREFWSVKPGFQSRFPPT